MSKPSLFINTDQPLTFTRKSILLYFEKYYLCNLKNHLSFTNCFFKHHKPTMSKPSPTINTDQTSNFLQRSSDKKVTNTIGPTVNFSTSQTNGQRVNCSVTTATHAFNFPLSTDPPSSLWRGWRKRVCCHNNLQVSNWSTKRVR